MSLKDNEANCKHCEKPKETFFRERKNTMWTFFLKCEEKDIDIHCKIIENSESMKAITIICTKNDSL